MTTTTPDVATATDPTPWIEVDEGRWMRHGDQGNTLEFDGLQFTEVRGETVHIYNQPVGAPIDPGNPLLLAQWESMREATPEDL